MSSAFSVSASPTIAPKPIAPWLEKIVEKKVRGVALSCFESFIHYFLTTFSCFYPSYQNFYQNAAQRVAQLAAQEARYKKFDFAGKVPLIDKTANHIVSVRFVPNPEYRRPECDTLCLNGHKVIFERWMNYDYLIEKKPAISQMEVSDVAGKPGMAQIRIEEIMGLKSTTNLWHVDTNKPFVEEGQQTVYFVEEVRELRLADAAWSASVELERAAKLQGVELDQTIPVPIGSV